MQEHKIYDIIKTLKTCKRVTLSEKVYCGLNDKKCIMFDCIDDGESSISIASPKNPNGDFIFCTVTDELEFVLVKSDGAQSELLDLSTEDRFFQRSLLFDLSLTYDEYQSVLHNFNKFYNGLISTVIIYSTEVI